MIRGEVYVLVEVLSFLEGLGVQCIRVVKKVSFINDHVQEIRWLMNSIGV